MRKRFLIVAAVFGMLLSVSCGEPGMGSRQLRNMKPRVLIATVAMHELLDENPDMDRAELARKAYEIADAMIAEAGRDPATTAGP